MNLFSTLSAKDLHEQERFKSRFFKTAPDKIVRRWDRFSPAKHKLERTQNERLVWSRAYLDEITRSPCRASITCAFKTNPANLEGGLEDLLTTMTSPCRGRRPLQCVSNQAWEWWRGRQSFAPWWRDAGGGTGP